jgi:hypothetical protein
MEREYYDPVRCIACSISVNHTKEQHEDYLSIWCEEHKSWCGDHTITSIEKKIASLKKEREVGKIKRSDQINVKKRVSDAGKRTSNG